MNSFKTHLLFLLAMLPLALSAQQFSPKDIDIPHQTYTLENGLRLVVHEDHKAPIVAVNVWYHVGSKNEKPGKSGFAHLFEHLMFNGSENFNDDYFQALERIGATDLNGTTNNDRTNYFQNVPVAALDQVLWLESDRMGHLLGAISQERLDEQRGVVQNEKRQGENQPYGQQFDLLTKALYPKGHPYSWTVIGEMEDLNAASLEDVKEWFRNYYGAANAVLVIAGDVNPDEVYQKVQKYFGDIPPGPTIVRPQVDIPVRQADTRQVYQDRVPEARIVMAWNTPQFGSTEDIYLDLVASILSSGKNSRLYKKLIYEDQVASSANAFEWSKEISSNFIVQVNVKPGQSAEKVEQTTIDLLEEFRRDGPSDEELKRAKSEYFANFIKGLERIGGFGGKSDILASNLVYFNDPNYFKKVLNIVNEATAEDIRRTAQKWLGNGKHTLVCTPFPDYAASATGVDRSKGLPPLAEPKPVQFPDYQTATLSNGMKIVLATRKDVPTVVMNMMFNAGYAADQFGKPGTASLAMNMMDEGTKNRSALEINEQLQMLGASISAFSDLDASYVTLNTLKPTLDASLDLYADVILNPAFPEAEFDRLKNQQLTGIQREKVNPIAMALRAMPKYLYGEGHAYSMPLTGSGYESTVQNMNREDVMKFYNDWIKPNNATLMVVGDIEMDELREKLEKRFASWKKGSTPKKNIATVKAGNQGKLYLMDRPESQQSVIIGGYLIPGYGGVPEIARETMNMILGGDFTSRLNMNLREDKHWAYGAGTLIWDAKGQRPMIAYAPVQTDKTKESVTEIIKEFKQFTSDKPLTDAEFEKVTTNTILGLPGRWETNSAVLSSLADQQKYNLPANYWQEYGERLRQLSADEVRQLSSQLVKSDQLSFFVVGDKEKVLPGLQELGFEIIMVDSDGNPIGSGKAKP